MSFCTLVRPRIFAIESCNTSISVMVGGWCRDCFNSLHTDLRLRNLRRMPRNFRGPADSRTQTKIQCSLLDDELLHFSPDENHGFPALTLTRYPKMRKNHRYFGLYVDSKSVRDTLDIIDRNFQLRTCSDDTLKRENVRA